MKYNKKGVSAVIATVLIILITVAAVAIIWAFILPFFTETMQGGVACKDSVGQLSVKDSQYTCRNASGNISLQLVRGSDDFMLADVQVLILGSDGQTTTFKLLNNKTTLKPGNIKFEDLPGVNEEKVYVINASKVTGAQSIQVAPIVKVSETSSKVKTCTAGSVVTLRTC
ncbi:MAG: archaellin/type IV pilin N-terminal domain-containing protein [Candidatus Pacearchaeota archaeon]